GVRIPPGQLVLQVPDAFLDLAADAIRGAFALHPLVADGAADTLLDAPLELVHLALDLIVVHCLLPSAAHAEGARLTGCRNRRSRRRPPPGRAAFACDRSPNGSRTVRHCAA